MLVVVSKDPAYAELQKVARRAAQRGCFTTAQAEAAGLSRKKLWRLKERGVVTHEARGVYRFAVAAAPTWRDRLAVELLGTGGTASGLTSSALYGLAEAPSQPSVLVPRGSRHAVPGRHTSRDVAASEQTTVGGLRALTPTRAVIDSVHLLPYRKAVALVESAIVRGLVKPIELQRRAAELAHGKRPGCAVVLKILADLHPELERSRNEWEALVARCAHRCGLPAPALEHEVFIDGRRYIADAAWPRERVALEFDGRDPHMRRTVHDYDTCRRNDFALAGWLRFGVTAQQLNRGDDRTFRQVARALASR